jgi:hypothetical protein
VLLLLALILKYFAPGASCGFQTGNIIIKDHVSYHFATTKAHYFKIMADLRIIDQVF